MLFRILFFCFFVSIVICLDYCMSTIDDSVSESAKAFRWLLRGFYSCGFCISFVLLLMEGFGMV